MNGTTSLIISGTIFVIIVAWLLMKPQAAEQVIGAIGKLYSGSVGALMPKG